MRGAKEIAQDLIGAFQSGVIDAEAFDQIMGELGVTIDTSKLKAADFPAVMAALNEQFGGTAQEQAKTYEGIQKRLANATSDLGEKIGGMLLPALSSITESMIPVVDWFGQAVDRAQGFLTEMGKMPEVQGIMDGLGEAFSGVGKYLADLQQFMLDAFGPALQELLGAFRELWDGLSPIGEALGEIFAAMTGGQGDFDLFKAAIQFVVDSIHRFVEVVKIVAPYIKQFAEAFKAAADFIVPILKGIHDAITGFVDGLKNAFQGFYTWLVGGSLWDDLWNRVGDIARNAGTVIAGIVTGMFTVLNGVFQGGIDLIGTILTAGFSLAFAAVQTIITGATNVLSGLIGSIQKLIQGTTKDWGDLVSTVSTTLGTLRDTISAFWTWTLDYWKNAVNQLVTITQPALDAIQASTRTFFDWSVAKFTEALTVLSNLWQTAWMQVETIVSDTYANIQGRSTAWWSMLQESFMTGLTNITEAWQISWTAILGIAASIWAHIETLLTTWFAQVATLFTANLATLLINWQTGWMSVQMSAVDICGQIMAGLTSWYQLIQDTTTGNLTSLTGTFQNMLSGISGIFTSTFSGMISSAQSSMSAIVSSVASALAQVQAMAAEMSAAMVGHSIWTGMLDEMQAQTTSALGNIVGDFQNAFDDVALSVPTMPSQAGPSRGSEASAPLISSGTQSITIPITVTLDGQVITKTVKKVLVEESHYRSRSVGGYT
jgi:phage-related protein